MARVEKTAVVTDVRERLEGSTATLLTEYRGLTVAQLRRLRTELRKSDAEYRVAKNTLIKIAARDAGFEVPAEVLTGPTAVTFCAGDPVATAKILRTFSREHPALIVKGGILDGKLLTAEETLKLADLASREELLARLAGLMEAVVAQPARLALAGLSKAARLFAALHDKRVEAGETSEAPQTAEAGPAPAPEEGAGPADGAPAEAPPADRAAGDSDPAGGAAAAEDAAPAEDGAPAEVGGPAGGTASAADADPAEDDAPPADTAPAAAPPDATAEGAGDPETITES
jgi:large subunit ribosomal protein L10